MYVRFRQTRHDTDSGMLFGPADTAMLQSNYVVATTKGAQANLAYFDPGKNVWMLLTERSDAPGYKYVEFLEQLPYAVAKPVPNR